MHSPYENTDFLINKKDEEALNKLLSSKKENILDKLKNLIRKNK